MIQMRDQNVWNVEWSGVENVVELQVGVSGDGT
jgi:hypothetical protein